MNKRYVLATLLTAFGILFVPAPASAHVFIKDKTAGVGAILHITPDDDPIAGEPATLFFDIQSDHASKAQHEALVAITSDQQSVEIPATMRGNTVGIEYIFEQQGTYTITLTLLHNGRPGHTFEHVQHVSRGLYGTSLAQKGPIWAEVGALLCAVAIVGLGIVAFNKRRAIAAYSQWRR